MKERQAEAGYASAAEVVLIALCVRQDERAFAVLVGRHQAKVRHLLRRLVTQPALADDLAQQVWLKVWQQLPSLREPQAFSGWLRKLALRSALSELRARRETLFEDLSLTEQLAKEPMVTEDPVAGMDLSRMLRQLRWEERACVVLCHAEGYSHGEISELTGWPLGTVKSHVTRGAARLRSLLGESPQHDSDERGQ